MRVEVAWDVAGEGLVNAPEDVRRAFFGDEACAGTVCLVATIECVHEGVAIVRVRLERGEGARQRTCEVGCVDPCVITRDFEMGFVHIDGGTGHAAISVTLRERRDGVTLIYARTGVLDMLGVAGGRAAPPKLRVTEQRL